MEIILFAAAPVVLAVLMAWAFPRFSRNFLGPAVIVLSVVAFFVIGNNQNLNRDAWGPASAVIALFVGGVGVLAGLILISLGALLLRGPGAGSPR